MQQGVQGQQEPTLILLGATLSCNLYLGAVLLNGVMRKVQLLAKSHSLTSQAAKEVQIHMTMTGKHSFQTVQQASAS